MITERFKYFYYPCSFQIYSQTTSNLHFLIILKQMEIILNELQSKKCWKSFLKTQCRRNKINPLLANTFTIVKIRRFYQKLISMEAPNKPRLKSSVWLENELKAFQWFLVAMSGCRGTLIQHFSDSQWQQLSLIFNKQESILCYQAIKLISQRIVVKRKWEQDEIVVLQNIIKENPGNNKWNEIARKLFNVSEKRYFRTGKQCRERWFNHLDPDKKHGKWESTEDSKIAKFILENGKKWSQIAKMLENQRTQHMVKNRFKTLTIRLKKKYKQIKSQKDLLQKYLQEGQNMPYVQSDNSNQAGGQEQLQIDGLPILESGMEDQGMENQNYQNENADKYPGSFRQCQIHQVVTPCPIIFQTFTPTFLNTPNSLTILMNYSFDQFDKHQNLFLKNS